MHILWFSIILLLAYCHPTFAFSPPSRGHHSSLAKSIKRLTARALPSGWALKDSCVVDTTSRVLASYKTITNSNTPASCISTCAAKGYSMAGVEDGTECYCANAYNGGAPKNATTGDCNAMRCPGDYSQSCGGSYRMRVFSNNASSTTTATATSASISTSPTATPKSTYSMCDSWIGSEFLNAFAHQAIPDPTHGRVNYVDQKTALAQNLTYASAKSFIIRADSTSVLSPTGPGRNSVRLLSHKQYTTHVAVFDIRHMPQGCGTWPALWELGNDWPNQGEIDIVEGVNDQSPNQATLHTNAGCTMPPSRLQTGTSSGDNCDVAASNNAGCGVKDNQANNYGPSFNNNGGGWYAVERTNAAIKVWFWSRNDYSVPWDVKNGDSSVNTSNWGVPFANFPNTQCDIASHFGPQQIVINLTFCGDWAGAVYGSSGCPGTCVDYVNNNPMAFKDAYFEFASARVYT